MRAHINVELKSELKPRILTRQVWCIFCLSKPVKCITRADKMIPMRRGHFDLAYDNCTIDPRVVGICTQCLSNKSNFHKNNAQAVDVDHEYLVFSSA